MKAGLLGTPDEIRTHDLLLRRQALYPAELRAHIVYEFTKAEDSLGYGTLSRFNGIFNQHGNGHRSHPAGNGR